MALFSSLFCLSCSLIFREASQTSGRNMLQKAEWRQIEGWMFRGLSFLSFSFWYVITGQKSTFFSSVLLSYQPLIHFQLLSPAHPPQSTLSPSQHSFSTLKSITDGGAHTYSLTYTSATQTENISCLTSSCFWLLYTSPLCFSLPTFFLGFQTRDKRTTCDH